MTEDTKKKFIRCSSCKSISDGSDGSSCRMCGASLVDSKVVEPKFFKKAGTSILLSALFSMIVFIVLGFVFEHYLG